MSHRDTFVIVWPLLTSFLVPWMTTTSIPRTTTYNLTDSQPLPRPHRVLYQTRRHLLHSSPHLPSLSPTPTISPPGTKLNTSDLQTDTRSLNIPTLTSHLLVSSSTRFTESLSAYLVRTRSPLKTSTSMSKNTPRLCRSLLVLKTRFAKSTGSTTLTLTFHVIVRPPFLDS